MWDVTRDLELQCQNGETIDSYNSPLGLNNEELHLCFVS